MCEAAGLTWKTYSENLGVAGSTACSFDGSASTGLYTRKHEPWTYYQNLNHANERPYSDLAADLAGHALPNLAFIIPNNCHNTHNSTTPGCGLADGDAWLAGNLPAVIGALGPKGLLVLTWDEDDSSANNHILTGLVGPLVASGAQSAQAVNHYTVVRMICEALGIPTFERASIEPSIAGVWVAPTPALGSSWGRLKAMYRSDRLMPRGRPPGTRGGRRREVGSGRLVFAHHRPMSRSPLLLGRKLDAAGRDRECGLEYRRAQVASSEITTSRIDPGRASGSQLASSSLKTGGAPGSPASRGQMTSSTFSPRSVASSVPASPGAGASRPNLRAPPDRVTDRDVPERSTLPDPDVNSSVGDLPVAQVPIWSSVPASTSPVISIRMRPGRNWTTSASPSVSSPPKPVSDAHGLGGGGGAGPPVVNFAGLEKGLDPAAFCALTRQKYLVPDSRGPIAVEVVTIPNRSTKMMLKSRTVETCNRYWVARVAGFHTSVGDVLTFFASFGGVFSPGLSGTLRGGGTANAMLPSRLTGDVTCWERPQAPRPSDRATAVVTSDAASTIRDCDRKCLMAALGEGVRCE
jgi:hypothetical protein